MTLLESALANTPPGKSVLDWTQRELVRQAYCTALGDREEVARMLCHGYAQTVELCNQYGLARKPWWPKRRKPA